MEMEANAEVDIDIVDVATVRVRGGRREAQQTAESLEERWSREVAPHLAAANVADLDGLSAKIAEAQELDTGIKAKDAELRIVAGPDRVAGRLRRKRCARRSTARTACRAALGDVPPRHARRSRSRSTGR